MPQRTLFGALLMFCTSASVAAGCGSSGSSFTGDGDTGGGGGGGDSSAFADTSNGDGGLGDGFAACATSQQEATLKPVNLVFLYDKSGSMGDKSRSYVCGSEPVECNTFYISGPGGSAEHYVCYAESDAGKLKFPSLTAVNVNNTPCPAGTVGSDAAFLCTNPAACTLTRHFDPAAKWLPVAQAIDAFFGDPKSGGMSASLGFFPKQLNFATLCQVSDYSAPAIPMRPLPDGASFQAAIAAERPRGNTPTEVALKGTIEYAKVVAAARPNDVTAIVLVSDGDPTVCNSAQAQPVSVVKAVAQAALTDATRPLKTYVIGVGQSLVNLNEIAAGGGTTAATLVDTSNPAKTSADLLAALEAIRGKELSCEVPLPAPPDGKQLDINLVNVIANVAGADEVLAYNKDCAGGQGWHYDAANPPTSIQLCDATCASLRAANGKLNIAFGCATKGGVVR